MALSLIQLASKFLGAQQVLQVIVVGQPTTAESVEIGLLSNRDSIVLRCRRAILSECKQSES